MASVAADRKVKFRHMLRKLADNITVEDRWSISHHVGVGIDGLESLEVLMKLEKEGHFSQNDVSGLKKLLIHLNRKDLNALVLEYLEIGTGGNKDEIESPHDVLQNAREQVIRVGDLDFLIDVTEQSPSENGPHGCYTFKIRSGKEMLPFSMKLRIHESDLECVIPDVIADGSSNTQVFIGDQRYQDIIATLQQQNVDLMKISDMVDGLEMLVYKQRERVEKQGAQIAEQEATIIDLQSKYSLMHFFVLVFLSNISPVYTKKQLF